MRRLLLIAPMTVVPAKTAASACPGMGARQSQQFRLRPLCWPPVHESREMKIIGIVGGIAWPSSIVYYRLINEMVSERLGGGGLHSARLVLA
jgi:hypothetical protein